jgi:ATP-dependent helicase/nuclease subunit A
MVDRTPTPAPAPTPTPTGGRDPNVDQRRAANTANSVWVSASAGSGKTKVLTDRILNLLLDGNRPERLLCLTFTKAAAAEMSVRLSDMLASWTVLDERALAAKLEDLRGRLPRREEIDEARRLFARVLDAPGGLRIATIHAFCQSLLRRFPIEAGVSPHFSLADDRTANELMDAARLSVLARARHGADETLADALEIITETLSDLGFKELMAIVQSDRARLSEAVSKAGGVEDLVSELYARVGVTPEETDWDLLVASSEEAAFDGTALRASIPALETGGKQDKEKAAALGDWLGRGDTADRALRWDEWRAVFLTGTGTIRAKLANKAVAEGYPEVPVALGREAERVLAVQEKRKAIALAHRTAALIRLAVAVLEAYAGEKRRRGLLDYEDLIRTAGGLLGRHGVAEWVLYKLDGGIDHILIDEAQDTAPAQWKVIRALAEEFFVGIGAQEERAPEIRRTVFAVGDRKQSIYSFQGADPQGFSDTRDHFATRAAEADKTFDTVPIETSFRSTDAVLDVVDAVFNSDPARIGVAEADPIPLDRGGQGLLSIRHFPYREHMSGRVELWPLVKPVEVEAVEGWEPPVARRGGDDPAARLATLIADRIKVWIGSEMLPARGRTMRAGDIMILVRRRDRLVGELVRALKRRDVPVAGVDRLVLSNQMAVQDLVALGRALLLPEDDLTLAGVLKSPLFGLSEEELIELAWNRPTRRLWHALRRKAETSDRFAEVERRFAGLLADVDILAPHELFQRVLADTVEGEGARRTLVRRLGPEAEEAIDEFLDQALAYEATHTPSMQGFLHWLGEAEFEVKREMDGGTVDQVRIMTVHGSKGLQAPVVILPDTVRPPMARDTLLWDESVEDAPAVPLWSSGSARDERLAAACRAEVRRKAEEEYRRLLYVAMTRAEDRLIVCGWHGKTAPPPLAWYPMIRGALGGLDATPLEVEGLEGEVGLVVESEQRDDARADRRVGVDADAEVPPPEWMFRMAPDEPTPPRPLAPTRSDDGEEPPVRSPLSDGDRFARGTLLHSLLQRLPEVEPEQRAAAGRRYLERPVHDLDPETVDAWLGEILAVLEHPDFAPVFGPGSRAEVPIVGLLGGGIVSRRIDRLCVTDETVLIVDFKTNRPPPDRIDDVSEIYIAQLAGYRALLGKIYPKQRVRCALLWTDAPRLMEVPDVLMDRLSVIA